MAPSANVRGVAVTKIELSCAQCRFVAFVDSPRQARSYGWHVGDDAQIPVCPDCVSERESKPGDNEKPKVQTA